VRCRSKGEPVAVGEAGDVADVGQGAGRNDGSDAVKVHQSGAAGQDDGLELLCPDLLARAALAA
jgi:hypothetical protein